MGSCFLVFLLGFLVLGMGMELQRKADENEMVMMEKEELVGLFEVMESLLEEPGWREMHSEPCTNTPWPGIGCEIEDQEDQNHPIFHITLIHIGPDVASPPCKPSANLSDSLLKLPYLKTLSIFNCFVDPAAPVSLSSSLFSALSSLEHLSLQSNPSLSGVIPPGFLSNLKNLRVLTLSENSIQGNIPPDEISQLVKLEQLDLSYNNFSGEIPKQVGDLESLTILDLSFNGFEGEIPSSMSQLHLLQKLDLSSNKLHGNLPQELGDLKSLVLLDFSHNFINGAIPDSFSGLENLQYLILGQNPINSPIPYFLISLKKLASLSFSSCGLTGEIPNFSSLKNLTALSLDNNSLSGLVPQNLESLPNLDHLNLSHNNLSGGLMLSENFIFRLGKRLDVRGNDGICICNQQYEKNKNISAFLETPPCLSTEVMSENRMCHVKNQDDDSEGGTKPLLNQGKTNSDSPLQDPHLISTIIVSFVSLFCLYV